MTDLSELNFDRFGAKNANQSDQTKDPVFISSNPTPKQIDSWRKLGQGNKGNEDDQGASNILTGTVITSCFIQTSALPSRVEIAGNDITFYDDTSTKNGKVSGDTSRIFFTHDIDSEEGFILEKRASDFDTYDNVFSFYALPPKEGRMNYMFFGREGEASNNSFQTNLIQFNVNHSSKTVNNPSANGAFEITGTTDGVISNQILFGVVHNSLLGVSGEGYSVFMQGSGTGGVYINNAVITLPGGLTWSSGVGSPEGVLVAPIGSLYSNKSGGASTTLYVKTSGTGNTGWTAK